MKAFLLAAGQGIRLRPLTYKTPKCLIPVNGVPLMTYWLNLFRKHGIDEVLINISFMPEKVEEFLFHQAKDLKVHVFYEEQLLGSLGTIIHNQSFFHDSEDLFIFYSDNLTNINLDTMFNYHRSHDFSFTTGLFHSNNPTACGIASINQTNTIVNFQEKPSNPQSDLANAGIYITNRNVFRFLPKSDKEILDIGFDLLPNLINHMKGYVIPEYLIDIGTIENLGKANNFLEHNSLSFV